MSNAQWNGAPPPEKGPYDSYYANQSPAPFIGAQPQQAPPQQYGNQYSSPNYPQQVPGPQYRVASPPSGPPPGYYPYEAQTQVQQPQGGPHARNPSYGPRPPSGPPPQSQYKPTAAPPNLSYQQQYPPQNTSYQPVPHPPSNPPYQTPQQAYPQQPNPYPYQPPQAQYPNYPKYPQPQQYPQPPQNQLLSKPPPKKRGAMSSFFHSTAGKVTMGLGGTLIAGLVGAEVLSDIGDGDSGGGDSGGWGGDSGGGGGGDDGSGGGDSGGWGGDSGGGEGDGGSADYDDLSTPDYAAAFADQDAGNF